MNKNRYILCLLLCGLMLYYAVPRLSVMSGGLESTFAITWLAFVLFAIAGNLTAMLYSPKKQAKQKQQTMNKGKRKRAFI